MADGLDPAIRAALDDIQAENIPPLDTLSVAEARRRIADLLATDPEKLDPVAAVSDGTVPGRDGAIPIRTYTPRGEGPHSLFVYYHGGGWVLGDRDTHDPICRALAGATGCVVVSVEYRRAPAAPFPDPLVDCYDATAHLAARPDTVGAAGDRLVIGGDSAGGNLAAAVALRARDADGPAIDHQVLLYPVTDHAFDTPSYAENATGYFLTRADMRWYWGHYLPAALHGKNPYASPLQARTLEGLPAASVVTAGFDPLRDEGIAYAERLEAAGVDVGHHHYEGAIHGFVGLLVDPEVAQARDAIAEVVADLDRSRADA